MSNTNHMQRPAWKDRFTEPTIEQIRDPLPEADQSLFDSFHQHVSGLKNLSHRLAWHGEGWYWTIEYVREGDEIPVAILIPAPEDVKVAMPIDPDFTRKISIPRLKRSIRDGLELSLDPFDAKWAVWSLQPGSFVDDLLNLVQRKIKFLASKSNSAA